MISRLLTIPSRAPGRTILLIGVLFAIAYGSALQVFRKPDGRIVLGDAVHYYVYLRSAVFDRDLQFENEYLHLYGARGDEPGLEWMRTRTATGHVRNLMSIGPALVWTPGYLAVTAVSAVANAAGAPVPFDGYGRWFQASAGLSGIAAATAGVWLVWLGASRLYGSTTAIRAVLMMWLGSSAIYYSVISPTYSHAASMLAAGGVFGYWLCSQGVTSHRRYFMVGVLVGLAALVRWQDVVFLLLPATGATVDAARLPQRSWSTAAARLLACGVGVLIAFMPQAAVWLVLYGQPFVVPQGDDWMRWSDPRIIELLFSHQHGLLSWTPIILPTLPGLVWLRRRDPVVGTASIAILLVSVYVSAAVPDWWAGEAFGARRLISCFPIFTLGMAAFVDRFNYRPGWLATLGLSLVALNLVLLLQYQVFMRNLQPAIRYPLGAVTAPADVARWLWNR